MLIFCLVVYIFLHKWLGDCCVIINGPRTMYDYSCFYADHKINK